MDRIISSHLSASARRIANRKLYKRQRRCTVGTRRVYGRAVETGQNGTKSSFELRTKLLSLPETVATRRVGTECGLLERIVRKKTPWKTQA